MNCDELTEIDEEIEKIEAELKKKYDQIPITLTWEKYSSGYSFRRARYGEKTFWINNSSLVDPSAPFTLSLTYRDENGFEEIKFLGRFRTPEACCKVAQSFVNLKGTKRSK